MLIAQATLRPGQRGTRRLEGNYGDRLISVRHRYAPATGGRGTTVELIEEELSAQPQDRHTASAPAAPPPSELAVRPECWKSDLRATVKAAGGIWRPRHKFWALRCDEVVALGLESRVVASDPSQAESAFERRLDVGA